MNNCHLQVVSHGTIAYIAAAVDQLRQPKLAVAPKFESFYTVPVFQAVFVSPVRPEQDLYVNIPGVKTKTVEDPNTCLQT